MKRLLSYFIPVTKKIPTEFNGIVELTYYEGRKMLNSEHANYSYDSLQRLLKFGLTKVNLSKVESILLLGLGGGSVIKTLTDEFSFKGKITAVELDKTIIEIAEHEFQIMPGSNLEIIHGDAFDYVKKYENSFDLIIVDLFIDNRVPDIFYSGSFWEGVTRMVTKSGWYIFNASATKMADNSILSVKKLLEKSFLTQQFDLVDGTNTLLIGQKL